MSGHDRYSCGCKVYIRQCNEDKERKSRSEGETKMLCRRSHDSMDRADLRIAGRSSRALSHSDVLRLASACAPSFAGCLGSNCSFLSLRGTTTNTDTRSARKALGQQAPCPYIHRFLRTYPRRFLFPTSVSSLSPARADRQPPLLPSFASEPQVNRPIRLFSEVAWFRD